MDSHEGPEANSQIVRRCVLPDMRRGDRNIRQVPGFRKGAGLQLEREESCFHQPSDASVFPRLSIYSMGSLADHDGYDRAGNRDMGLR